MKLLQIAVVPNCSILAAVGQKMASTPGVSATLFNALAKVRKLMDLLKMLAYHVCFEYYPTVLLLINMSTLPIVVVKQCGSSYKYIISSSNIDTYPQKD